jgi:hypothetical protein
MSSYSDTGDAFEATSQSFHAGEVGPVETAERSNGDTSRPSARQAFNAALHANFDLPGELPALVLAAAQAAVVLSVVPFELLEMGPAPAAADSDDALASCQAAKGRGGLRFRGVTKHK